MFNDKKLTSKIDELNKINNELIEKTTRLNVENKKTNALLVTYLHSWIETFSGETNKGDLPIPKEIVMDYYNFRLRSWNFILKNHIASLIINKRVNWVIGSGLLFNAKPSDKPFIDYYGDKRGPKKHRDFIRQVEYQFRNYIASKEIDYTRSYNLHEMARIADYNASGDGDILILMRVKNGFPTVQLISGQCVVNPVLPYDVPEGNTINEGVEKNQYGEVVAYHVMIEKETSNTSYSPTPKLTDYGTERIPVYFKGTNIKQAWLYRANDLQKLNETRSLPLISTIFETLQHVNDYLIANSKNAQLAAQLVMAFEKDSNSDGTRVFNDNQINVAGMSDTVLSDDTASDTEVALSANKLEYKLNGNGIVADLPKGVKAKLINDKAQSDQKEYLDSTLRTVFATAGTPYEVMISSYDSNYSASMGARADYQYNLDITTEIIPSNQLYKMVYNLFIYLQVLKGEIDCIPLKESYEKNDIITIQALTNSVFEGTKLKPIDPVKFISSLRAQLPESIREQVALNTIENLVNAASNGDYEGVINQVMNEIEILPKEFKAEIKPNANGKIPVQEP